MLSAYQARAAETEEGIAIEIWYVYTASMHQLVLKKWPSSKSYVFIRKWNQNFVKRRELKRGDKIGFYRDPYYSIFNFSVLERASAT
ncbi:hypothetical protein L6164_008562 [Bauhinia variegata]|uniref:Uncharacterized protein n=1 Tax=Bauhinia variegata TaxID=167791 RepID=A0ACB9PMN6_BAUVA|nr:hypothetical protein L6164_008562 [Bauhinia variegata]